MSIAKKLESMQWKTLNVVGYLVGLESSIDSLKEIFLKICFNETLKEKTNEIIIQFMDRVFNTINN